MFHQSNQRWRPLCTCLRASTLNAGKRVARFLGSRMAQRQQKWRERRGCELSCGEEGGRVNNSKHFQRIYIMSPWQYSNINKNDRKFHHKHVKIMGKDHFAKIFNKLQSQPVMMSVKSNVTRIYPRLTSILHKSNLREIHLKFLLNTMIQVYSTYENGVTTGGQLCGSMVYTSYTLHMTSA